jgi:hypothetical protein
MPEPTQHKTEKETLKDQTISLMVQEPSLEEILRVKALKLNKLIV